MPTLSHDKRRKVKKPKTVSQLKRKADKVFSEYIRRKYADEHTQMGTCVTCGLVKPWQELQCGHYERRSVNQLRYDERNCNIQCAGCNVFKSGNYPRYAQFMLKTYGPTILDELAEEAKKIKRFTVSELVGLIEVYKAKVAELTAEKG